MKILQLGKFYPICGGVEKVMWDLTRGLSLRNITCDMLCCGLRGELHEGVRMHSMRKLIMRFNDYGSCIVVPAMARIAATMISPGMILELRRIRDKYDIIHIHHPDPMAALALRMSGFKGKVVLHWHSDILKQEQLLKFYRPLLKWVIRRADVIVGTTPVYVRHSPLLRDAQEKISVIPIGIAPVSIDRDGAARIKDRFAGKKIVYSLGRLVEYKGFEYLVEAARYLPDDYHILIGGDGPLKKELQDRISQYSLDNKVTLLGYIDNADFAAYYSACDVFALSSIYKTEAFAIVQIEAMSCGKPVVATEIEGSGVSWVNKNGFSGLNVPPKDGKALADAILALTAGNEVYEKYSKQAYERYNEFFTYNVMIERCMELYNSLL